MSGGSTVKLVLFCGFQRQREPTLAERKICVFGELFASAHQAKAVCVRNKKPSVRAEEKEIRWQCPGCGITTLFIYNKDLKDLRDLET